jgi:hypothetical protein
MYLSLIFLYPLTKLQIKKQKRKSLAEIPLITKETEAWINKQNISIEECDEIGAVRNPFDYQEDLGFAKREDDV